MSSFILRRLLHAIPLLLAVVVLNFLLIAFTPGDPITLLVGDFPAPPEYLDQSESDRVFIENADRAIGEYSAFLARAGDSEEYARAVQRSREQIEDLQAAIVFVRSGAQTRAFRQQ